MNAEATVVLYLVIYRLQSQARGIDLTGLGCVPKIVGGQGLIEEPEGGTRFQRLLSFTG